MDWNGQSKPPPPGKSFDDFVKEILNEPSGLIKIIAAFVILMAGLTSFYTVQPEEEAVVQRFGRFLRVNGPGLNFKLPFGIDTVTKLKTAAVLQESFGFYSEGPSNERAPIRNLADESLMLSGDLNVADVQWVVHYRISDAQKFLFRVRDPRRNIRDISQATMRRVVGDRIVNEVLTVGRDKIAAEGMELTQAILDSYEMGVKIERVILQDVNPPEPVKPSFNDVNAAKQEQEQAINQAEAHYNKVIPEAQGKAQEEISNARGYAAAVLNRAKGDADKIAKIMKEYKNSPEITKTRLYLELMEELFARFKSVTIVDPDIKGVLPVLPSSAATLTHTDARSRHGGSDVQ